jgi:hypothetical protein
LFVALPLLALGNKRFRGNMIVKESEPQEEKFVLKDGEELWVRKTTYDFEDSYMHLYDVILRKNSTEEDPSGFQHIWRATVREEK